MARIEHKTIASTGNIGAFLAGVADERSRADAHLLVELIHEATGEPAVMWGTSIVGFGSRHYRYESGREGDISAVGFSPRKSRTAVYLTGALERYDDLLARLGPHTTGKGCLYVKRVDDVDREVLREMVVRSQRLAVGS